VTGYVAIEGVDGAGKSTVASAVTARLRSLGRAAELVREPGGTSLGEDIRHVLLHGDAMTPWAEALLFAAQRAQLAATVIAPALAEGRIVVTDRSYYSSLAYQGGGRGLGVEKVRAVNEAGLAGVVPDVVVVLWLDPDTALARQAAVDRIGGEGREFQRTVAETYRLLAAEDPDRVHLLDAARPLDDVVDDIVEMVK